MELKKFKRIENNAFSSPKPFIFFEGFLIPTNRHFRQKNWEDNTSLLIRVAVVILRNFDEAGYFSLNKEIVPGRFRPVRLHSPRDAFLHVGVIS